MPKPELTTVQKSQLVKLGEIVKRLREQKGLTLEEVANKTDKDRQSIHRFEKGESSPSLLYLMDVCEGLGISIIELLELFLKETKEIDDLK